MDVRLSQLDFVLRNGLPALAAAITVLAVVVRLAGDLPGLLQTIRRRLGKGGRTGGASAPEPAASSTGEWPQPARPAPSAVTAGREPTSPAAAPGAIPAPAPAARLPGAPAASAPSSARGVLLAFGVVVLALGVVSVIFYWPSLVENGGLILYAVWLFVTMIAGMFVQVIVDNYRAGEALFSASGSQLALPLLFSIIVYYPIWAFAASSPQGLFAVYTAFMNGYFWQHIVAAAKPPQGTAAAVPARGRPVK